MFLNDVQLRIIARGDHEENDPSKFCRCGVVATGVATGWAGAMPITHANPFVQVSKLESMMIVNLPRQWSPQYFEGGYVCIHGHDPFCRKAIQILQGVSDLHQAMKQSVNAF
jgi:hypothetical protein